MLLDLELIWNKNKHAHFVYMEYDEDGKCLDYTAEQLFNMDVFIDHSALQDDLETVNFWKEKYGCYFGKEKQMLNDEKIKPIRLSNNMYVLDGYHRLVAAKLAGLKTILAVVEDCEVEPYE